MARKISRRFNRRIFKRGLRTHLKNIANWVMRGGYRI